MGMIHRLFHGRTVPWPLLARSLLLCFDFTSSNRSLLCRSSEAHFRCLRSGLMWRQDGTLFLVHKFSNAVDANGAFRHLVDEDVRRMHIFKSNSVGDVIHSISSSIVTESHGCHKGINFFLCGQTKTTDIRLNKDNSEETVSITGKADDSHRGFREKAIVKNDGIKSLLGGGIY